MLINTKSIRTKLLLLLAGIALAVGGVSVLYDLFAGEAVIRDQIVKRGRYVASNLAFNAKYGVLTEDKPLLTQFLEGAVAAGGEGERSDVVGAMIRAASWPRRARPSGTCRARRRPRSRSARRSRPRASPCFSSALPSRARAAAPRWGRNWERRPPPAPRR
jgi:hypothetical protein